MIPSLQSRLQELAGQWDENTAETLIARWAIENDRVVCSKEAPQLSAPVLSDSEE